MTTYKISQNKKEEFPVVCFNPLTHAPTLTHVHAPRCAHRVHTECTQSAHRVRMPSSVAKNRLSWWVGGNLTVFVRICHFRRITTRRSVIGWVSPRDQPTMPRLYLWSCGMSVSARRSNGSQGFAVALFTLAKSAVSGLSVRCISGSQRLSREILCNL